MRLLLDHCVPRPLARELVGHEVVTAREQGWESLKNGQLLRAAGTGLFGAFITVDQNMAHQQHVGVLPLPVIVLVAKDTTIDALRVLLPKLTQLLGQRLQRQVYAIDAAEVMRSESA